MSVFDNAEYTFGLQGPPGAATVEQVGNIESRLTAVEGTIDDVNDTMDTFPTFDLAGIAPGDLLQYDGTKLVKYTPPPNVISFSIPFPLGTGTGPVPVMSVPPRGVYIPDGCTIVGYVMDADNAIAVTVERALAASPMTYAVISGSETPTRASSGTTSDFNLTTWTTAISAGDRLRAMPTGTPLAWSATLNLILERTL